MVWPPTYNNNYS